jgi:hypothetical protein
MGAAQVQSQRCGTQGTDRGDRLSPPVTDVLTAAVVAAVSDSDS